MVGSSPIRSSSPMLTRPSHNPNPIQNPNNPERKGTGVRKSFNGYPLVKSSLVYQQKGLVPNTPVNSPAEYARGLDGRNSGVVSFRDHEQKENQSDLNIIKPTARAKSPSVNKKGTKHFMSPTISAASKINPSPRKKVLGDRNEAIRTSVSLSDGKFHFFSTSSLESDDEQDESKSVMPTSFDKASEPDKHEFQHQNGCLPLSEMPTLVIDEAPLDADQSLPPYDPKRNYLSPRPQFLHYNPNWRTENYVNQGMNLEDDFTSESVSEIENSSEEAQSEDSLKDQEDASSVTSSNSSVEVSLEDMPPLSDMNTTESPRPVEMVEAELEPMRSRWFTNWKFVAVLLLISLGFMSILLTSHPGIGNVVYRDEIISRVYNNPQAAALVEHFSEFAKNAKFWAASCVDYMQNEILSRVYNNPHTAALVEHFSGFAENAKFWAASCVDYMSQILQNVGEVDSFSSVTFSNLTAWQEEEDWGYFVKEFETEPYFGSVEESQGYRELPNVQTVLQNYEIKDEASVQMQSYPAPEDNNDSSAEVADIVKLDDSQPEDNESLNGETGLANAVESEDVKQNHEIKDEASEEMQSYSAPEDNENLNGETGLANAVESEDMKQNHEIKDEASEEMQSYSALEDNENSAGEAELVKTIDSELINEENAVMEDSDTVNAEQALSEDEPASMVDEFNVGDQQTDVTEVSQVSEIQREVVSTNEPSENDNMNDDDDGVQSPEKDTIKSVGNSQFWKPSDKSLAAMAAAITLVIVSLLAAFMYMKTKKESPLVDQNIAEKEPSVDEAPSSYSGPVEVDMVGESCPSEMSSFHNSVYTKSKQMDGDEAHSLQKSSKRNVKRESLASSSSEYSKDPSYGSFSTYSIIHPKKGDGEVVTPVRRSSRIRSKVTSP